MARMQPLTTDPTLDDLLAARPAFSMHAQDGLCFEDVPLHAIADTHGTPCWVYGAGPLRAFDIAGFIADHVRFAKFDAELGRRLKQHSRSRLSSRGWGIGSIRAEIRSCYQVVANLPQ